MRVAVRYQTAKKDLEAFKKQVEDKEQAKDLI